MTDGQRRIVGIAGALLFSAVMWMAIGVLIGRAFSQERYESARVVVEFGSFEQTTSMCGMLTEGRVTDAISCANRAQIVAPHPCLFRDYYARILCHEVRCHVTGSDTHHLTRNCRERV
jgi:hypothetical protein